jgi:hypothetical protein
MSAGRIKEGSYYEVEASFYDSEGEPVLPGTVHYQIFCKTTNRAVRDTTEVPIGTTVTITALPADNAILSNRNPWERKQMVVIANMGTDIQHLETIEWIVDNLGGFR